MKKFSIFLCVGMLCVFGLAGISYADCDPICDPSNGEEHLFQIVNRILPTTHVEEWESSDAMYQQIGVSDANDDWWRETNSDITVKVVITVRYAGYQQQLHAIDEGGTTLGWVDVPQGTDLEGIDMEFNTDPAYPYYVWADRVITTSDWWYSDDRNSTDDHFVAFDISDFWDDPSVNGAWLIAFEDTAGLGDQDYNDLIAFVIECAPTVAEVPDVVGMIQADAELAIQNADLVPAVTQVYDCAVPAGEVISQDPAAGTSVDVGSTVDLVVSLGVDPAAPVEVWVNGDTGDDNNDGSLAHPFATIQKGICEVAVGGTVHVAAWTYNESLTVNKALTLLGAKAGVDARTRVGAESIVIGTDVLGAGHISAISVAQNITAPVTINGFTFRGERATVDIRCAQSTFVNNIVEPIDGTPAGTGGTPPALVYFNGNTNNVTIRYNDISPVMDDGTGVIWPSGCNALRINFGALTGNSALIDNNHLHNASSSSGALGAGLGIEMGDSDIEPAPTITVTNNEMDSNGSDGMFIWNSAVNTLSVLNNDIHDNGECGVKIAPNVTGAIVINYNDIINNNSKTCGVLNENTFDVNATYNWWGDVCGPSGQGNGMGDAVSEYVLFDPWLTDATIYEDGEDGGILGWSVFDTTPVGATISNVADLDPGHGGGRAIQLSGSGTDNAYLLINEDQTMWGNADQMVFEWKMKYSENFYVYVEVQTTAGKRYIYYTPVNNDLLGNSTYVHHGLGSDVIDGQWHTFSRDLEADLWDGQPSNNIQAVNGLYIRGTGRIDDVLLYSPDTYLSIDDVSVDESAGNATFTITADPVSCFNITVNYRTGNGTAVAGEDYASTMESVTLPAGESFVQVDIPLFDDFDVEDTENFVVTLSNAINARISDRSGTATISDNDVPPDQILYEDAEDGNTSGWTVSDNVPGGAAITNVLDSDPGHGGHVIQLWGSGTANAYEFRCDGITGEVGSPWNNTLHTMLVWSMKTLSNFYVYVDVDTTDGNRLLYYTPSNTDFLGTGLYVHHGLGTGAMDGQWHTFERDLLVDLRHAQPGNNIEAVNGIYIRGNLWIDDIILKEGGPKLSIADASVSEDGGTMVFTITTSLTSPDPITVEYYTMDDIAVAPDDYDAITLGTAIATIDPDGTETQISVTINDDTTWEGFDPETFYVILSNPSSNAGIKDGVAIGSIVEDDPQPPTVYEDAEDGLASRWIIFDSTPPGASITNVEDLEPGHSETRAIEVSGYGTDNAYLLTNEYGTPWHNATQFMADWNLKYSEFFYFFVEVETTAGTRYLYYTPVNGNQLGKKEYVHHGLTPAAMDGTWQHFTRNLQQDLKDAQPTNNIEEVTRVFIRGSGKVDDIALSVIP